MRWTVPVPIPSEKLLPHLAFGRAVYLRPAEFHALGDSALEAGFDSLAILVRSNSAKPAQAVTTSPETSTALGIATPPPVGYYVTFPKG
jgi:hypothetical protein